MTVKFSSSSLSASKLQAIRGDRMLFEDLSFELSSKQALRIEGANGAGKTTLLRMLVGLGFIHQGQIKWNQDDIHSTPDEYNQSFHYLGHQTGLKLGLTANENLLFIQTFLGKQRSQQQIDRILELLNLTHCKNIHCHALSAGEKQRLALARLDLAPRPLWVLDEAFTSLDIVVTEYFENRMRQHLDANGLIVFTSHQPLLSSQFDYHSLTLTTERAS